MTPQPIDHERLSTVVAQMAPAPWEPKPDSVNTLCAADAEGETVFQIYDDLDEERLALGSLFGPYGHMNHEGIIALRNAAPAFIQRSRLLEEASILLQDAISIQEHVASLRRTNATTDYATLLSSWAPRAQNLLTRLEATA